MNEKLKYSLWGLGFLAVSGAIIIPISVTIAQRNKPSPISMNFTYSANSTNQKQSGIVLNSYQVVKDNKEQSPIDINYILTINDVKKMIELQTNKETDFFFYESSFQNERMDFNQFYSKNYVAIIGIKNK